MNHVEQDAPRRRSSSVAAAGKALAPVLALALGAAAAFAADERAPGGRSVTALGRLTPGREVVAVTGSAGSRVARLEVSEGQEVEAGSVIAYLDGYAAARAERDRARALAKEAVLRLDGETAHGEALIAQAQARVAMLEARLAQGRRDLERLEALYAGQLLAEQSIDDQRLLVRTRSLELEQGRAELRSAQTGLELARTSVAVDSAKQNVRAAEARLEQTIVRAPSKGRVLRISTYPGEAVSTEPIVRLGDTDDMQVVAEVDETDVRFVEVGQRATIEGPALPAVLAGRVIAVGWMVYKNDVLDIDPRSPSDARVVEVRIRLDDSAPVRHLSQMQVRVRIETPGAAGRPAR